MQFAKIRWGLMIAQVEILQIGRYTKMQIPLVYGNSEAVVSEQALANASAEKLLLPDLVEGVRTNRSGIPLVAMRRMIV